MIINHTHRFVFIHIPKAAGTTVTRTLSQLTRYCDQEIGGTELGELAQNYFMKRFGIRKHSRAEAVMNVMGPERYMSYFRFAFVRNPYTRLASAYYFLKSWEGLPQAYRDQLKQHPDFGSFLESDMWTSANSDRGPDGIFRPQAHWLFSQGNAPKLLVDFIGKTESLAVDLAEVLKRIGVPQVDQSTTRSNSSPSYSLPRTWEPRIVQRIQQEYIRDFKMFNYPLEPPVSE